MADQPVVNPYITATIGPTIGFIAGAAIASLTAWLQQRSRDKEAVRTWFQDQYIVGCIDLILDTVRELRDFGSIRPKSIDSEIRIPIEAVCRLDRLVRSSCISSLVMPLHPIWRREICAVRSDEYYSVIQDVEGALDQLRIALLQFRPSQRSDITQVAHNVLVCQALEKLNRLATQMDRCLSAVPEEIVRTRLKGQRYHHAPSAWDSRFGEQGTCPVLVTLTDGKLVPGIYGPGSFASTTPTDRDLYLSELLELDADGNMKPPASQRGILLRGNQIQSIQFYPTIPGE